MNQHFFLSIYAVNQGGTGCTQLLAFSSLKEADAYLRHWLTLSCGLDCYCGAEEESRLRAENGGERPELSFVCPEVKKPSDLEAYNGYHYYGMGGAISLFVMAIYDEESAKKFKKEINREFNLDKVISEEADDMLDMLELLVKSFSEEVDYETAVTRLDRLLKNEGLSLF